MSSVLSVMDWVLCTVGGRSTSLTAVPVCAALILVLAGNVSVQAQLLMEHIVVMACGASARYGSTFMVKGKLEIIVHDEIADNENGLSCYS